VTTVDVDSLRGQADRHFPALYQLFGGYFHQDWKLEYDDWTDAVAAFAAEAPPHLREDAVNEIARVLAWGLDEAQLDRFLYPVLQCNCLPRAVGLSPAQWLGEIASRLRSAPR
jgi:hypothetical protein